MSDTTSDDPRLTGITEARAWRCHRYPVRLLYGDDVETSGHIKRETWMVDAADWEWLSSQYASPMPPGPYTRDQIAIWSAQILANRS